MEAKRAVARSPTGDRVALGPPPLRCCSLYGSRRLVLAEAWTSAPNTPPIRRRTDGASSTMGQISFWDSEYVSRLQKARREVFLDKMRAVVPWKAPLGLNEPHHRVPVCRPWAKALPAGVDAARAEPAQIHSCDTVPNFNSNVGSAKSVALRTPRANWRSQRAVLEVRSRQTRAPSARPIDRTAKPDAQESASTRGPPGGCAACHPSRRRPRGKRTRALRLAPGSSSRPPRGCYWR